MNGYDANDEHAATYDWTLHERRNVSMLAMRPAAAAVALDISEARLQAMIDAGTIPVVWFDDVPRLPVSAVDAWLTQQATGGKGVKP